MRQKHESTVCGGGGRCSRSHTVCMVSNHDLGVREDVSWMKWGFAHKSMYGIALFKEREKRNLNSQDKFFLSLWKIYTFHFRHLFLRFSLVQSQPSSVLTILSCPCQWNPKLTPRLSIRTKSDWRKSLQRIKTVTNTQSKEKPVTSCRSITRKDLMMTTIDTLTVSLSFFE